MKFTSRYIFLALILMILLSGGFILLSHQGIALKLFIISFWIMVLGIVLYIFELKNED